MDKSTPHFRLAIQVGNNITGIMKLPCVIECRKRDIYSHRIEYYYTLYPFKMAQRSWRFANLGDWLCEDEQGKWHLLSNDEYQQQQKEERAYGLNTESKELVEHNNANEDLTEFEKVLINTFEDYVEEIDPFYYAKPLASKLLDIARTQINKEASPNSEWSEGIEERLNRIANYLRYKGNEDDADWLKSLRPQYQWKPSEAQMGALKDATGKFWEPDGLDPLYTLYQDLKKLTE